MPEDYNADKVTDQITDDEFEELYRDKLTAEENVDFFDSKQASTLMIVTGCGMLIVCVALFVCLCRCVKRRRNQKIAIAGETYEPAIKTERA